MPENLFPLILSVYLTAGKIQFEEHVTKAFLRSAMFEFFHLVII